MIKKIKAIVLSICFLISSSSVLFAVEAYVSDIYREIDVAFVNHNSKELNEILEENSNDKNYYLIENYAEKKIRRLIIKEDYDFAMDAIVVVIDNNLENENAVEMYNVIYESYKIQQEYELKKAKEHELELARIEKAKESKREVVEKEYVSANTAGGSSVYISGKETKLSKHRWNVNFGIVDLLYLMDTGSNINSFHYGVSLDASYAYMIDNLSLGVDGFAEVNFLGFCDDLENKLVPVLGDFEITPKMSFKALSQNLFFKVGFGTVLTGKNKYASLTKTVNDTLLTPIVGVEMTQIPIGSTRLDLGVDWYPGHLFTKNLKLAMGAGLNLAIPVAELDKVNLSFNVGLKDKIFLKQSGFENRGSLILAIGVENVIK